MFKRYRAVTALIVMLLSAVWANAQPVAGYGVTPIQDFPKSFSTTTTGTQFSVPTGGYAIYTFQPTSVGSGNQVAPEISNDGTNWVGIICTNNGSSVSTTPSLTSGVFYNCQLTGRYFRFRVTALSSGTLTVAGVLKGVPLLPQTPAVTTGGDGQVSFPSLVVRPQTGVLGPIGWEDMRSGSGLTLLASAARTATTASSDQTNYNRSGTAHVVIDMTAVSGAPSLTCTIQGKDELSSKYYTILASAAISTVSTTVLRAGRGFTASANAVANDVIPRVWRVNCVHGTADSITYSVGASVLAN